MATKAHLKKVTAVGILPRVTVERRHHWCHVWWFFTRSSDF